MTISAHPPKPLFLPAHWMVQWACMSATGCGCAIIIIIIIQQI